MINKLPIDFSGDWYDLCCHFKLSEDFMRKHKNQIFWDIISGSQELSESFIDEFSKRLNWTILSKYQKMSKEFLIKNIEKINVEWLSDSKFVSREILEEIKILKKLVC